MGTSEEERRLEAGPAGASYTGLNSCGPFKRLEQHQDNHPGESGHPGDHQALACAEEIAPVNGYLSLCSAQLGYEVFNPASTIISTI